MPASDGKPSAAWADASAHQHLGAIARGDAELTVEQPLEHVVDVHPAHQHVFGLAVQHRLVAEEHLAVEGGHQVGDERSRQQRGLRQRPRGQTEPDNRSRIGSS